ncbi:hypothetical protein [Planifilum fulgidum]|uniref:hypothetical protein n=1 Tax=Planifilum fulgidum TaxID=201973 RepID=UPI0011601C39|nr:hypothetical protein [Planifilum fulgidum]
MKQRKRVLGFFAEIFHALSLEGFFDSMVLSEYYVFEKAYKGRMYRSFFDGLRQLSFQLGRVNNELRKQSGPFTATNIKRQKRWSERKRPPAQYLPDIDDEKLEREALRKAEYIYVDKDKNVVYFFYDTRRPVGYDGGDETTWIRAELRKDKNTPVLHGHPISVKRLENEYLKDKNKKPRFLRRKRMGE